MSLAAEIASRQLNILGRAHVADVFISYAREDRDKVANLAAAIEAAQYTVWWDRRILAGTEFSEEIERELNVAKVIIVVWSADGVKSRWVKDEAVIAQEAGKIIPVSLDGVGAPIGFRQIHAITLSGWNGSPSASEIEMLNSSIAQRLGANLDARGSQITARNTPALRPNPRVLMFAIVVLGLVLVGLEAVRLMRQGEAHRTGSKTQSVSIAVLPFSDLSETHDKAYFADGVAEEILNALSQLKDLHVVGRTSSFAFRDKREDLRAIGQSLGVSNILEGSVRSAGTRLRITAQLTNTSDGFQLWSQTYDRPVGDIFAIQEEIASSVAQALSITLTKPNGSLRRVGTSDIVAYQFYLQGQYQLFARQGDSLVRAINYFNNALSHDSRFARAYASLAQTYYLLPYYTGAQLQDSRDRAAKFARRAIELDDTNADAYAALGAALQFAHRWSEGTQKLNQAVALDPSNSTARLWLGISELYLGRATSAEGHLSGAITIDPASGINRFWHAAALMIEGRSTDAQKEAQRAVDLGFPFANQLLGYLAYHRGDFDEAARYQLDSVDLATIPASERELTRLSLQLAFAGAGSRAQIEHALDRNFAQPSPVVNDVILIALMQIGRVDQALSLFELGRLRSPENVLLWLWQPANRPIRQSSVFKTFALREKLVEAWSEDGWPDSCHPKGANEFACD